MDIFQHLNLPQKHALSNSNLLPQIMEWRKIEVEVARRDMIWWRRALMRGQCTVTKHQCSGAVFQNTPVVHHRAPKFHSASAVLGGEATTAAAASIWKEGRRHTHSAAHSGEKSAHAPWRSGCLLTANHYSHYRETPNTRSSPAF